MKNDGNRRAVFDLAMAGGFARSAMFAMFLPVLFPIYLWDNWSSANERRSGESQEAQPAPKDD